jgi:hypothetical protein
MLKLKPLVRMVSLLFVLQVFNGCTVIREPLDINVPKPLYTAGKCILITDDYLYAVCAAEQIEALKADNERYKLIIDACTK